MLILYCLYIISIVLVHISIHKHILRIMPVSVQQWRGGIGSFTHARLVNRVPYTHHAMHNQCLHLLLKYLLLCVFYTYTYVYTYMLVQYILSSCMVKLFFSVSVNNLAFSSVDDMLLYYTTFQYISSLH